MRKHFGPIQNKRQADALAAKLDKVGTLEADGAATMLRRNWHSVAARPMQAAKMVALADVRPLDATRDGSVAHRLLQA